MKHVLIAGALGVIGRALIDHLEASADVRLTGLARRSPDFDTRASFIAVDLLDRDDSLRKLGALTDVTHVVYAAWLPGPSREAEVAPNLAMLTNLMDAVGTQPSLRHVTLLQGSKAYGSHLGPFRTPARETDPRHMPPNFYYDQHDFLTAQQHASPWTWTVLRPTFVYGYALGNPMNLATVIAVYAAFCRELGLPFRFPGSQRAYEVLSQAVDATLIAKAIAWSGESPAARNEVFNLTNGDLFRWSTVWPKLAAMFDLRPGEPQRIPLTEFMASKEPLWNRIVARHGLQPIPYRDVVSWPFGESSFNRDYDHILDTTKLRAAGFDTFEDTERMFERQIRFLRDRHVIP